MSAIFGSSCLYSLCEGEHKFTSFIKTVFSVSSLFLLYTLSVKMHVFKAKHEHCVNEYGDLQVDIHPRHGRSHLCHRFNGPW